MDLPKSKYSIGDKRLDELTHIELLTAIEDIWQNKNAQIAKAEAQRDAYLGMLTSNLPIHSLWRGAADNGMLLMAVGFLAYFAGAK